MAAKRFWAPLFLLIFASSWKHKWSTSSFKVTRSNYTRQLVLFREFSRSKSWNVCYSFHHRGLPQLAIVLLLGGDVEPNPGDKFSCDQVKINQKGIQCDECNSWFHSNCCNFSPAMYNILANSSCTWICPTCGLPNLSVSFFENSMDTVNTSNYFELLNEVAPIREQLKTHVQSK